MPGQVVERASEPQQLKVVQKCAQKRMQEGDMGEQDALMQCIQQLRQRGLLKQAEGGQWAIVKPQSGKGGGQQRRQRQPSGRGGRRAR